MAVSPAAKSNHDQLFGDRVSTLAQTDPELIDAVNDVLTEAGVELPLPGQSAAAPQTRLEHGKAVQVRELLTFAMLVALGGADAQVRGHVNGNLRVGNTRARLLAVLTVLVPFIGYPRTLNGLAALNDITGS